MNAPSRFMVVVLILIVVVCSRCAHQTHLTGSPLATQATTREACTIAGMFAILDIAAGTLLDQKASATRVNQAMLDAVSVQQAIRQLETDVPGDLKAELDDVARVIWLAGSESRRTWTHPGEDLGGVRKLAAEWPRET